MTGGKAIFSVGRRPDRREVRKPLATLARLQSRPTVLWDAMRLFSVRQGWMAALLASILALFVLVSAVEAATCAPESVTTHASETIGETPTDPDGGGDPDSHAICSHGHCHHSGTATAQTPDALTTTQTGRDTAPLRPADPLASRMPTGPDRPPRG